MKMFFEMKNEYGYMQRYVLFFKYQTREFYTMRLGSDNFQEESYYCVDRAFYVLDQFCGMESNYVFKYLINNFEFKLNNSGELYFYEKDLQLIIEWFESFKTMNKLEG